jgi:hypothetical protein
VIGGASAVAAFGDDLCSVKGMSRPKGVTNNANGVTVSVLGYMFGGMSAA